MLVCTVPYQLSYEATQLGAGQFVKLVCSVASTCTMYMYAQQLYKCTTRILACIRASIMKIQEVGRSHLQLVSLRLLYLQQIATF